MEQNAETASRFYVVTFHDPTTGDPVYSMDDQGETFQTLDAAQRFAAFFGGEGALVTLWEGEPHQITARLEITEHA